MTADGGAGSAAFRAVPLTLLAIAGATIAVVTWRFSPGSLPGWMPPLWVETSAIARDSTIAVGPIVAALGAWIGGWRHTAAVGAVPARGWGRVAVAQLAPLLVAVLAGSAVGLVPAAVDSFNHATAGGFQPLVVLSAWAGIAFLLVAGFALGVAWRSRLAVAVAAIAPLPVIMVPILLNDAFAGNLDTGSEGRSFLSVALVWLDFAAGAGQREVAPATIQRLALFSAAAGAATLAAIRAGEPEPRGRLLGSAAPFTVPALFAVALLVQQPHLVRPTGNVVCESVADSAVCVADDASALLKPFADGVAAVVETFGTGALTADLADGDLLSDHSYTPWGEDVAEVRDDAVIATARAVAGSSACTRAAHDIDDINPGGALYENWQFAGDVAYVVARKLDVSPQRVDAALSPTDPDRVADLEAMSVTELRTHLHRHADDLHSCSISTFSAT